MLAESKVSLLSPKCFLFLAFHKAGLTIQLALFLKHPQRCGQETHCKSLILPDKTVMKPSNNRNGGQVTPSDCCSSPFNSIESESFMKFSVDAVETQAKIK